MKYIYEDTDESRTLTATEFLRKYGLYVTEPRIAVVEDLMHHRTHATADEIYNRLSQIHRGLSRASVYNILNSLAERHSIRTITIDERQTRYDIDRTAHAHFRCTHCGKVYDVDMPTIGSMRVPKGFLVDEQEVYYTGICSDCAVPHFRR